MPTPRLLDRDGFRGAVLARDKGRCVICGNGDGVTAHHVMERRLFRAPGEEGGYFADNGASLCPTHHWAAETTEIGVEPILAAIRAPARITPAHLELGQRYDKWANPILPNGRRMRGELFFEEPVQKALRPFLDLFSHHVKFPRTLHLPWSPGLGGDDKLVPGLEGFRGRRCVAGVKYDGENTTMYADHIHARSLDGRHHVSRDWVKGFWAGLRGDIPPEWRVCGENVFARHSIAYVDLPSWFMGFQVWDAMNVCLGWDETLTWLRLLGIVPMRVIYDGVFDEPALRRLHETLDPETDEGFVLRVADPIPYRDYGRLVAKWVRPGHVQTDQHWMAAEVVRNGLGA